MSRVWNSRAAMSNTKLKVKLRSPQQRRSPSKYAIDFEGDLYKITGRRTGRKRGASPAAAAAAVASDSSHSPSPERGRSRDQKKKKKKATKKGRSRSRSTSSSLSSLSSVSRSRSRSRSSSSSDDEEVFGKTNRKSAEFEGKKKKRKGKHKSHSKSHHRGYSGENADYYQVLEDDVNREKRADKCRTSKKAIQFIDHTKNRSTTYLKRSGSLILAAKELEIQTHCIISLHIQPTWPRGKQYRYLSGSNVHSIRSAEFADRWVGPNMCHVCGEQAETSLWLVCGHSSSRRKQGCNYRVHCHCVGLYYSSAIELGQVPFYCPKHGRYHKKDLEPEYEDIPLRSDVPVEANMVSDVNGTQRQISGTVERSNAGSVLVHDSNAPLGSEVIHVIDSATGLRSAVRVDSTTASGTEMLLHFHSSIVQSAEMTGDPNAAMVLELPNDATTVPVSQMSGNANVTQAADVNTETTTTQVESDVARTSADQVRNIKVENDSSTERQPQQVVIEQVKEENVYATVQEGQQVVIQDGQMQNEYSAITGPEQVVAMEEVQVEAGQHYQGTESEQVVMTEEVIASDESNIVAHNQHVVAVEEVHLSEDAHVVQGSEQVVVQEVEMEGEYVTVPEEQMIVEAHDSANLQLGTKQRIVFVSSAQVQGDPSEGVVFQMAGDTDQQTASEVTVYSQQPAESVAEESVVPTKLEMAAESNADPESEGSEMANQQPGTEIIHVVDSNTGMVLEVQRNVNTVSQ